MTEKQEKYIELQRQIIAELDGLITEAKKIRHNVFRPKMQPKDRCPDIKKYGETFKGLQQSYRQSAIDFDKEIERKEVLLNMLQTLEIDREKVAEESEEAYQELMEKGQQEWEQYKEEYFQKYPERKARYEAYLANGGEPIEW